MFIKDTGAIMDFSNLPAGDKKILKDIGTTFVKVEDLIPYTNNSRTHSNEQVTQIAGSIKEFGFLNPIVVEEDGLSLLAGHGRLMAAKKLKLEYVPIVNAGELTEGQKKAFIIADNKIAENAGWDEDILAAEFQSIKELGIDHLLTGFENDDIADIFENFEPEQTKEVDENEVPDIEETEPRAKSGQLWKLGDHRLICGDSTDKAVHAKLMGGEEADMVFTDPPYGVDYEGINNDDRGGLEDLLRKAFGALTLKNGASVYVFHSDKCADIFHKVFREFFHFSSMLIWLKPALVLSQTDYQSIHEPCMYGWAGSPHRWFSDRKQTSVIEAEKAKVDGHTTPKPISFIEQCLNNSSLRGEIVLEPFCGSGSTLIACEKANRVCYGIELDPKYVDVIIERWENYTGQKAELLEE